MMQRKNITHLTACLIAGLVSSQPVLANSLQGIYQCTLRTVDSSAKPAATNPLGNGFFSAVSNNAATIFAPLYIASPSGDFPPYNNYAVLVPGMAAGSFIGLSNSQLANATLASDGGLKVNITDPTPDMHTEFECRKIW